MEYSGIENIQLFNNILKEYIINIAIIMDIKKMVIGMDYIIARHKGSVVE